jgi:hypothetical protein
MNGFLSQSSFRNLRLPDDLGSWRLFIGKAPRVGVVLNRRELYALVEVSGWHKSEDRQADWSDNSTEVLLRSG